ncbi:hypothetical protein [Mesorhizobium sp. M0772]|uniref:hypothetical protein n=1 Tax=Mesorhizobium sp. M0772 TaxID=2956998 RepID=UPI003338B942
MKLFGELRTLDTVTVGDLRARRLARSHDVPSSANSEIWFISAGSGDILENTTSTNIGFTLGGGNPSVTAQTYRVVGASEIPAATAAKRRQASITIPADGIAFISLIASGTTSGSLSNVTEDFSALCERISLASMHQQVRPPLNQRLLRFRETQRQILLLSHFSRPQRDS